MTGSFRFRCGSRRSVVWCDVVCPLLSGLAEGRVVACRVARDWVWLVLSLASLSECGVVVCHLLCEGKTWFGRCDVS